MKRKSDDMKNELNEDEIKEEEEDDNDFILNLRPRGTLAIKVIFDQVKWNAELALDKPSREVKGVPPLTLTITPLQMETDDPKSSLHLIMERETSDGVTELMNAHLDTPHNTEERVFSLNPYLGVLPLYDNLPFTGGILKSQSITASTKKRKEEKESYLLKICIEDGDKAVVSTFPSDSLYPIETGSLMMEQTSVSVSKEYLGLQSEYFKQIFYGGYKEGSQEIVELQDVNAEEGHLLINNLYARRPTLNVEDTRALLTLADRFSLVTLMRKCIEDLLRQDVNLSGNLEARAQFLLMADRSKSSHAMEKILATFTNPSELREAILSISGSLTHASMIAIFDYTCRLAVTLDRQLVITNRTRIFFKFGSRRCVVQLLDDIVPKIAKRFYEICHREYRINGEVVVFNSFHKLDIAGKTYSTFKSERTWTDGLTEQYVPDRKDTGLYLAARIDPTYREHNVYLVKHTTRFTNAVTFFGRVVEGSNVPERQPEGARFHFGIY